MKKIVSIIIAVMMSVSVLAVNAVPTFAVWYGSIESAEKDIVIKVTVDGESSINGSYVHTTEGDTGDKATIEFVYTGDREVVRWDITDYDGRHLVEGKDYVVVKQDDTTILIKIINENVVKIWGNVITTEDETVEDEEETTKNEVVNPDKGIVSPKTGVGTAGVGIVAAGVGVAVLGATRKRK